MALGVAEAIEFVAQHGVVLAAAKGSAPRLTEAIVGEPISGGWWSHPRGKLIFNVLSAVCESDDVLVCRLLDGKVTLVHRRLWPALVRLADRFDGERLAQVRDEHTAGGRHVATSVPFADWVPAEVRARAKSLSEAQAVASLGLVSAAADTSRRGG